VTVTVIEQYNNIRIIISIEIKASNHIYVGPNVITVTIRNITVN